MKLIKHVLFLGLFFVCVAAGIFVAINRGLLPKLEPKELLSKINPSQVKIEKASDASDSAEASSSAQQEQLAPQDRIVTIFNSVRSQDAKEQLSTLNNRTQEVGGHVGNVLGRYVQVNEDGEKQAFQDSAFEYARYAYCQQIIKEFDQRNTSE